jgi:RNA polymerase sigma-70 factor, ECF subfamily
MLLVIKAPSVDLGMTNRTADAGVPNPTARLTSAMRRGDEDAYREFFQLYFHRLLAYLIVVTRGDEELARDLLQQTMIKVAKHIRVFDDEVVLWRWLALLARTAAVDHGRKSQRYFGFLKRFWNFRPPPPATNESDGAFEDALSAQMQLLEPEDRRILEQKYFDRSSVKEIAAELNLTEKAVESRLTRARAKLKQQLLERLRHE